MKPRQFFLTLLLGAATAMLSGPAAVAGLPQPMCVYYGQACDGYGLPYVTNAEVILLHGANEIARQTIGGSIKPGVNFALYVHLDDGRTSVPYSERALRTGDLVSIVVRDAEGQKTIMENQAVPPVGQPGELVFIHATAATDLDADGLPDDWEKELIAWSGGALKTLADVRGGDDFDGDGMSNLQEYLAGTFAFLPYDFFLVEWLTTTPNNRVQLTFLSVPGKVYSLSCVTNLTQAAWQPFSFALSDTGAFEEAVVEGTGYWISLYLSKAQPVQFMRLRVE